MGTVTIESDDSFLYEIEVNGTSEIKPWLRSFGSSARCSSPAPFAWSSSRNGRRLPLIMSQNPFEKIFNYQIMTRLEETDSIAITAQERGWLKMMLVHPEALTPLRLKP